jgi:hypothetical protein
MFRKVKERFWQDLTDKNDPKNDADPTRPGSTMLDSRAQLLQEKNKLLAGIASFS